jgi:uncharacterized alkaline shock family protein YloU
MDATGIPGRVTIASRAYERIAAASAAEALGIPRRSARARVRDERGRMVAEVTAGVASGGEPIVDRARTAQSTSADRLTELTGATVDRVRVHITHVIDSERRVS